MNVSMSKRNTMVIQHGIVTFLSPERAAFTSVGQRPTYGVKKNSKPCKGDIHLITPLQGLIHFVARFVGRCPTLMNVGLSALTARRDAVALPFTGLQP